MKPVREQIEVVLHPLEWNWFDKNHHRELQITLDIVYEETESKLDNIHEIGWGVKELIKTEFQWSDETRKI